MFDKQKVFQKNEKVRLRHTLIECIITDKFECENPKYWVYLDGEKIEKSANDLSYNIWKTLKINFDETIELIQKGYIIFFGSTKKETKSSHLKILIGICIGLLLSHIIKH